MLSDLSPAERRTLYDEVFHKAEAQHDCSAVNQLGVDVDTLKMMLYDLERDELPLHALRCICLSFSNADTQANTRNALERFSDAICTRIESQGLQFYVYSCWGVAEESVFPNDRETERQYLKLVKAIVDRFSQFNEDWPCVLYHTQRMIIRLLGRFERAVFSTMDTWIAVPLRCSASDESVYEFGTPASNHG